MRKLLFTMASMMVFVVPFGATAQAQDAVVMHAPPMESPVEPDNGVLRRSATASEIEPLGVYGGLAILALALTGVLQRRWALAHGRREAGTGEAPTVDAGDAWPAHGPEPDAAIGRVRRATARARLVPEAALTGGTTLHASAEAAGTTPEPARR